MMRDGPARGYAPILGRAPRFLRVVYDARRTDGQHTGRHWDVLDQVDDEPREGELIFVYRLAGAPGYVCGRGRGGSGLVAEYVHVPEVDGESVRETAAWRAWAQSQAPPVAEAPRSE